MINQGKKIIIIIKIYNFKLVQNSKNIRSIKTQKRDYLYSLKFHKHKTIADMNNGLKKYHDDVKACRAAHPDWSLKKTQSYLRQQKRKKTTSEKAPASQTPVVGGCCGEKDGGMKSQETKEQPSVVTVQPSKDSVETGAPVAEPPKVQESTTPQVVNNDSGQVAASTTTPTATS